MNGDSVPAVFSLLPAAAPRETGPRETCLGIPPTGHSQSWPSAEEWTNWQICKLLVPVYTPQNLSRVLGISVRLMLPQSTILHTHTGNEWQITYRLASRLPLGGKITAGCNAKSCGRLHSGGCWRLCRGPCHPWQTLSLVCALCRTWPTQGTEYTGKIRTKVRNSFRSRFNTSCKFAYG